MLVGATVESIVTDVATTSADGPVFEAVSITEPDLRRSTTVPSDVHTTLTVTETFAVLPAGDTTQPVAVPPIEKSPATMPLTDSENVSV